MQTFTITDLSFTYPTESVPALQNVSLSIEAGSFTVLCGRSGCGKSTLFKLITGELPADGGTVSRVYQNSLTEYAPEGDVVYIVTDTATLAGLGAEYTVLRDYGDVFWSVRMNINDLTANFTTEFVLPEAPQYGVGRRG